MIELNRTEPILKHRLETAVANNAIVNIVNLYLKIPFETLETAHEIK